MGTVDQLYLPYAALPWEGKGPSPTHPVQLGAPQNVQNWVKKHQGAIYGTVFSLLYCTTVSSSLLYCKSSLLYCTTVQAFSLLYCTIVVSVLHCTIVVFYVFYYCTVFCQLYCTIVVFSLLYCLFSIVLYHCSLLPIILCYCTLFSLLSEQFTCLNPVL